MRKNKNLPSQELLIELIDYNPKTGFFKWKPRNESHFTRGYRTGNGNCNNWNARFAGKEAFTALLSKTGERQAIILNQNYLAHRVAWKIVYNQEPEYIVHVNGDRADNRIENLLSRSLSYAHRDIAIPSNNKSGVVGVFFDQGKQKWRAEARLNGKSYRLGAYGKFGDAVDARKEWEWNVNFKDLMRA